LPMCRPVVSKLCGMMDVRDASQASAKHKAYPHP
jgi:hypothetical protein